MYTFNQKKCPAKAGQIFKLFAVNVTLQSPSGRRDFHQLGESDLASVVFFVFFQLYSVRIFFYLQQENAWFLQTIVCNMNERRLFVLHFRIH